MFFISLTVSIARGVLHLHYSVQTGIVFHQYAIVGKAGHQQFTLNFLALNDSPDATVESDYMINPN